MGVLSIGLLGVAAVIPLGHHNMMEATKADRAAACGQAGLHEVKIRRWLNPAAWRQLAVNEFNPSTNWAPYTFPVTYDVDSDSDLTYVNPDDLAIPLCDSFAIDPQFFAHRALPDYDNGLNPLVWRFPLDATAAGTLTEERRSSLVRVTFALHDLSVIWPVPPVLPFAKPTLAESRFPVAAANRIFTWRDDLLFPVPAEADDRPRQMVMADGGQGFAAPVPSGMSPVMAQADDNYTWMATVTPILDGAGHDFWVHAPVPDNHYVQGPGDPFFPTVPNTWTANNYWKSYSYLNRVTRYTVSIVVFYKRNLECPTDLTDPDNPPQERSVQAYFPGDGYGGGDVLLVTDNSASWLDVETNGWLMLRGREYVGAMVGTTDAALEPYRKVVAKWYRVVAVDDEVVDGDFSTTDSIPSGSVGRYVTLSGPDWRMGPATATLVDDVIGVYTTTVETD